MGVVHLNNQGGTRSRVAQENVDLILSWVGHHVHTLIAVHIPEMENCLEDFLRSQ